MANRRVTLMEVWIEPNGVWAGILRMLGYYPARRRGLVAENWVSYGTERWFQTEGDLYESITGRRSEVIDEADRKRRK